MRSLPTTLSARFNDTGRLMEDALLNGLFEKQGLKRIEPSQAFRDEFAAEAQKARAKLPESLVAKEMLQKIQAWQAEYQKERHASAREAR